MKEIIHFVLLYVRTPYGQDEDEEDPNEVAVGMPIRMKPSRKWLLTLGPNSGEQKAHTYAVACIR